MPVTARSSGAASAASSDAPGSVDSSQAAVLAAACKLKLFASVDSEMPFTSGEVLKQLSACMVARNAALLREPMLTAKSRNARAKMATVR